MSETGFVAHGRFPSRQEEFERVVCANRFLWLDGFGVLVLPLNPFVLSNTTEELKGDREIVMAAVSQFGPALKYATEELKGDHEIVMAAVSKQGMALEYATEELKGDRDIVLAAVSNNGLALRICHRGAER